MKLYIKNMVCPRCIVVIERELADLNIPVKSLELGVVEFNRQLSGEEIINIRDRLFAYGFQLLQNNKEKQVEQIKMLLIKELEQATLPLHFSIKKFLSANIARDYSFLSKLFSESEKVTIEQYFILLRLEKVKELLSYDELSLNEIAHRLGYGSSQHLSAQFKKTFGLSASHFKRNPAIKRNSIDGVLSNKM